MSFSRAPSAAGAKSGWLITSSPSRPPSALTGQTLRRPNPSRLNPMPPDHPCFGLGATTPSTTTCTCTCVCPALRCLPFHPAHPSHRAIANARLGARTPRQKPASSPPTQPSTHHHPQRRQFAAPNHGVSASVALLREEPSLSRVPIRSPGGGLAEWSADDGYRSLVRAPQWLLSSQRVAGGGLGSWWCSHTRTRTHSAHSTRSRNARRQVGCPVRSCGRCPTISPVLLSAVMCCCRRAPPRLSDHHRRWTTADDGRFPPPLSHHLATPITLMASRLDERCHSNPPLLIGSILRGALATGGLPPGSFQSSPGLG